MRQPWVRIPSCAIWNADATARWQAGPVTVEVEATPAEPVPARRILHWLVLAAVPSGLMLSTTSHLTTDLFAMPLLWVIPLGIYLLSFVAAFSDKREVATAVTWSAPLIMLLAGGTAMISRSSGSMTLALGSVALLFVVAVVLHARLYDNRPPAARLTLFYLVMSAGGALGGVFTGLIGTDLYVEDRMGGATSPALFYRAIDGLLQRPGELQPELRTASKDSVVISRLAA